MATRDKAGVDYVDVQTKNGTVKTLSIKLYAPDGSVFRMPHGGDPLTYVAKGYLTRPDDAWREKNREHEEAKAESLKISNFQREIKNREKELEAKKARLKVIEEMEAVEAQMAEAEAALDAKNTPEPVAEVEATEESKPKAKRGRPAKAKTT